jgi:hypothetical protein
MSVAMRPGLAEDAVGNYPYAVATDTVTAYVSNLDTVSVIPLRR